MSRKQHEKVILSVLVLGGIGVCLLWYVWAINTKRTAAKFLTEFGEITSGATGYGQVQQIANTFPEAIRNEQRYVGTNSRDNCAQQKCNFAFLFDNGWIRRLRLAPPVWIRANVVVDKGAVSEKHVEMGCGKGPAHFLVSITETPIATSQEQPLSINHRMSGETDWRISIRLTSYASKPERSAAYALNVSRLAEFGACGSAERLFPGSNIR